MKKTVIITAIGSFSADIAIHNCHALGFRVVGTDIYPEEWVAQSLDTDAFYQVNKAVSVGAYIEDILTIIKKEGAVLLMPSTDAEADVLNRYRDKIAGTGCTLCLSRRETVELCRDKRRFAGFIGGFDSSLLIPTDLAGNVPRPDFPVVCKPTDGRSSIGMQKIYDREHYDLVPGDFLVQPFIEGNIITVDVVRHPLSLRTEAAVREELLRTPSGAGTSVRIFRDPALESVCRELAGALMITGCVCFEFIRDPYGTYRILECNPRLSGGVAFSCIAGYNFIKAHVDCFLSGDIDEMTGMHEMYIARKYNEYIM